MSISIFDDPRAAEAVMAAEERTIMQTYRRYPIHMVRGEGCLLWDAEGNEYLDCLAGISVVSVGHCRPEVTRAVAAQMSSLVHVTNLFYTSAQLELAGRIRAMTGWGKVFFSNSGAEANECALKLARLHGNQRSGNAEESATVVALENSFHGRTMGTLSLTGQPAKWVGFEPLLPAVRHVAPDDFEALEAAMDGAAAVFVEVVQGEGGVTPVDAAFLKHARSICDTQGALLVVDEVQTGLCRTGSWLAFESVGIEPDIYTLGKALGNGLPIAATVAREEIADLFEPGGHGTTMGGGPVLCQAALAVLDVMEDESLCQAARLRGAQLAEALLSLDGVGAVRGRGLLLAAEVECDAPAVVEAAMHGGLILNAVTPTAVRFAPPLVISEEQVTEAVEIFDNALTGVNK